MANKNKGNKKVREDKLKKIAEDENVSVFKRVAVLLGVLLIAFVVILVAIKIFFEVKYRLDKDDIYVISNAKNYGLMLEAVDMLDDYTKIDSGTKKDLEKNAKKAIKKYDDVLMDSERLAGLLLADKYLELDNSEKLINEMKEYYDKDSKLICNTKISKTDNLDRDELAANTISVAYMLRRYDDVFAEMDIYSGLADFFNEKIEASNAKDYSEYLREIFFFMYEENKQSMLKTEKLDELLKDSMDEFKTKVDTENMLCTINDLMMAKRLAEYRQFFYNDLEYADSAQEIYEEISNEASFMMDTYGDSYMYALVNAIYSISDVGTNEYFTSNVGDTFEQFYNKYLNY